MLSAVVILCLCNRTRGLCFSALWMEFYYSLKSLTDFFSFSFSFWHSGLVFLMAEALYVIHCAIISRLYNVNTYCHGLIYIYIIICMRYLRIVAIDFWFSFLYLIEAKKTALLHILHEHVSHYGDLSFCIDGT